MQATTARVRFAEHAREPLLAGCRMLAEVLAATLGPGGRTVLVSHLLRPGKAEALGTAGLIARRIYRLPDPFEHAGAMLLRHAVWRVYDRTGDGSATTAVLAMRLLEELQRLLSAGLSWRKLAHSLHHAETLTRETLRTLARPVEKPDELSGLVRPLDLDSEIVHELIDLLEAIGPDGIVLVDPDEGRDVRLRLVQGVHWQSRLLAPELLATHTTPLQLTDPAIFLTDWPLTDAEQVLPLLDILARRRISQLLIVAAELSGSALALLQRNLERGTFERIAAVAAPSVGQQRTRILDDLAAITGGRALHQLAGERPQHVTSADLGRARQALVTRWTFALIGGHGSYERIAERRALARSELASADDDNDRRNARERLARLAGTFLHVRVGGANEQEREYRMAMLEALTRTIQTALDRGLVPGGGIAFVVAARALEQLETTADPEERAIRQAMQRALLAPLSTLAANAGIEPGYLVHRAWQVAPHEVYDVVTGRWVDPWQERILDPLGVLDVAVEVTASLGRAFLTTEVLVHRTWPASSAEP